jgi:hypothetical protein
MPTNVPASCSDQSTVSATTTQVFGCDSIARRKAISITQGQLATIRWQMADQHGVMVDLTTCLGTDEPFTGSVKLRVREALIIPGTCSAPLDVTCDLDPDDLLNGWVEATTNADMTRLAGIYLAEFGVFNASDKLIFANQFYLIVNRGLFTADPSQVTGLPSVAEIRLHLRDSSPADNTLIEDVQFDLAEIAAAIEYPILYWNEALPPVTRYTTQSFPHRYHWMQAIVSRLYLTAAHWFRRNKLKFQAEGSIGLDDLNKDQEYERKAQELWAEYTAWVQKMKVGENALGFMGWS